jgi:hypothetical protein
MKLLLFVSVRICLNHDFVPDGSLQSQRHFPPQRRLQEIRKQKSQKKNPPITKTTMPTTVAPNTAAVGEADDSPATDDDLSTLSNSSFDPSEKEDLFCQQLAQYLRSVSDDNVVDKDILRQCRRHDNGCLPHKLSVVQRDYLDGMKLLQNEVDRIDDDRINKASIERSNVDDVRAWLEEVDNKVEFGSLSQDEDNKASNIASLTEEVGGDLVSALCNPSPDQLKILLRRKSDLSWRMKAVLCDFDDNQDIKLWFGQPNFALLNHMHKCLLDIHQNPSDKARVVLAWNKLSRDKQTMIKKVLDVINKCNKELQHEIDKEGRKLERERNRERRKKQKTTTATAAVVTASTEGEGAGAEPRVEIYSAQIDGLEGASSLSSLRARPKEPALYSSPRRASQLNNKQARQARANLEDQFFQSGNSINPKHKPSDENWANVNSVLVTADQTTTPPRIGYGKKDRNIIQGDPNAVPTNIRVHVAHGGEDAVKRIFLQMLQSRMFDEEVDKYVSERDNTAFDWINYEQLNEDELRERREKIASDRQRAEKQRSVEEVNNDPDIGATTTVSNDFE